MGHTSLFERMRIISLFNQIELGCKNKYKVVSEVAKNNLRILISSKSVKRLVDKWIKTNKLADRRRANKDKRLISNAGMLAINQALLLNPCYTLRSLKEELNIFASTVTISRSIYKMGRRHTLTKYCQIIRPVNRLKRFIYASLSKRFGEDYEDAIFVDEANTHF